VTRLAGEAASQCIELLRDLVTMPSPSRGERLACERVMREMETLGYRDVHLDEMGNVLGRFGSGPRVLAFDAHVDTVGISNPTHWKYDPFRGVVSGGILYGRGASDQKGGLAAVIHGAALADRIGLPDDLTVWVTATVNGEDCVGLAWQYLVNEADLRPEAVVDRHALPPRRLPRPARADGGRGHDPRGVDPRLPAGPRQQRHLLPWFPSSTGSPALHGRSSSTTRCSGAARSRSPRSLPLAVADRDPRRVPDPHRPPAHHRRNSGRAPWSRSGPSG
jgi:hypothetical protein